MQTKHLQTIVGMRTPHAHADAGELDLLQGKPSGSALAVSAKLAIVVLQSAPVS